MILPKLPQKVGVFVDDGRLDRSKESFQGVTFDNVSQAGLTPISFHRADFRKAKFRNCHFQGNDFSRSDFISCIIHRSKFIDCDFLTSSIMYSVFENCLFRHNRNFSADLFRCSISQSVFSEQEIARATWRDTAFSDCRFTGCTIERSTFERLEFVRCELNALNLSQASINDVHFDSCSLIGAVLDPDYLGTYTFSRTDLSKVEFSYRTLSLDFRISNKDDFESLEKHFEEQQRWSEAFNIVGIKCQLFGLATFSLADEWKRCLVNSVNLEIPADAAENVRRLFRLVKHYFGLGLISISESLQLAAASEMLCRLPLNLLITEELADGAASLVRTIETFPDLEEFLTHDGHSRTLVRFQVQLDTEDEHAARDGIQQLQSAAVNRRIPFEIIRVGHGSVIIEAATWFAVIMMLFRAARSASVTFVQIRLILKAESRLLRILDHTKQPKNILDTVDLLFQRLPKEGAAMDLVREEVDEIGRAFQSLAHHVKIGGTDLLKLIREVRIFIGELH